MSLYKKSKAWFLGPKAENDDIFEKLLLAAFRDYCYWRRNFHPEDAPYVEVNDRMDIEFQQHTETLHDHLFEMLSHLKRSVPSFSPRYLGHMMTDLLIPGTLGYMSAMLYNQNNIIEEAATITMQFEAEGVQLISEMLGLPEQSSWGHLCSGGTIANIESLWVARNICFYPFQIALVTKKLANEALANIQITHEKRFSDILNQNQLINLTIEETLTLHEAVLKLCQQDNKLADCLETYSLSHLGVGEFVNQCKQVLKNQFPTGFKILLSRNVHYSMRKSLGLLGLGTSSLIPIDLDSQMRINTSKLQQEINNCHQRNEKIMAVIGVYGSTEEGSLDDFHKIIEFREHFRKNKQGDFWVHGDACYGGYALSMMHPQMQAESLSTFMKEQTLEANPDSPAIWWTSERAQHWLTRSGALGESDSISIDPHKLGYIPYPAGTVLYRDYRVREFIRLDAPYLNAVKSEDESTHNDWWDTPYLGKYTLEGSRPGAYGAAVWLAHKTVPLNCDGHGQIVAQSILGACYLQKTMETLLPLPESGKNGIGCTFLCEEADLNMLCYTFPSIVHGKPVSLSVLNQTILKLYEQLLPTEEHPTQTKDFVVAMTRLEVDEYGSEALKDVLERLGILSGTIVREPQLGNPWRDDTSINLLRTVVMGPFLLHAQTRPKMRGEKAPLVELFAAHMKESVAEMIDEVLNQPIPLDKRPVLKEKVMILEDNRETVYALKEQLCQKSFKASSETVHSSRGLKEGLELASHHQVAAALIGVDLGLHKEKDGIQFLRKMITKPYFKGAVIFSIEDKILDEIRELSQEYPEKRILFRKKPYRSDTRFQEAINGVMHDLWDILHLSSDRQH